MGRVSTGFLTALMCGVLVLGCGDNYAGDEALTAESQQDVLQTCVWHTAGVNQVIQFDPGPKVYTRTIASPYGTTFCPNQANVALTRIQNRTFAVDALPSFPVTNAQDCNDLRIDVRIAQAGLSCTSGSCWVPRNPVTFKGVWSNGACQRGIESGSTSSLSVTTTSFAQGRVNARVYRASNNVNFNGGVTVKVATF
jgi:hypothetical protein